MWKQLISVWLLCFLLAGCARKDDTAERREEEVSPYPIVETLASAGGTYIAETHTCRTYAEVFIRHNKSGAEWKFVLPDGSPIPEYTFLPEDWGEWLETNTLRLTIGQGGDAGEQRIYRCSVEMDAEALVATSVLEQTGEILDADYDFTHDGRAEELERMTLLDPDTGEPLWHEIWLRSGAGERIWSYDMAAGGPSWNTSLFVVKVDGQDCLMELVTGMGRGNCSYFYEVFALSESGERLRVAYDETEFDVNFGSPIHERFDCADVAEFLWQVKELTAEADSILMDMDVEDGLRCLVPAEIFTHDYHYGDLVVLDSREEIETALRQMVTKAEKKR